MPHYWRARAAARFIDLCVVGVPVAAGGLVVQLRAAEADGFEGLTDGFTYLFWSAGWLLLGWPVYEAVGWRSGGTVGKRIMRLQLRSVSKSEPSWTDALWRGYLISWPLTLGVVFYAVPSLLYAGWWAWDAGRRADRRHWVDRSCDSVCVPMSVDLR